MSTLTFHRYDVVGAEFWDIVVSGMRNSWESWEKGDSYIELSPDEFFLGNADQALAQRLTKIGSDHGKYLRQLFVAVDITAPAYFWREFDTYHVGVTSNSTSQMHILGRYPFSADMFAWDDIPQSVQAFLLIHLNHLRDDWIAAGKRKGPEATEWRAMVQAIPDSWLYRRSVTLNYQVLRHMYFARRYHRLQEWRDWCAWTLTLPNADLITVEA